MQATSDKIIRNTVFSMLRKIVRAIGSLLLIPTLIMYLGYHGYGLWALIAGIIELVIIFDLGIETSFVKFISENATKKDSKKINNIINTGFIYYLFQSLLLAGTCILLRHNILEWLEIPVYFYNDAEKIIIAIIAILFLRTVTGVFATVLTGFQRIDIISSVAIISTAIWIIGAALSMVLGWGFNGLIAMSFLHTFFTIIAQIVCAYKVFTDMKFNPFGFDKTCFKEMFHYGISIQFAKGAELVNMNIDKILLQKLLPGAISLIYVGLYEISSKIVSFMRLIPEQLLPALNPASSELSILNESEKINKLFLLGSKYMSMSVFPLCAMFAIFTDLMLIVWLNDKPDPEAIFAIRFLSIGTVFFLLASVGRMMLRGIEIPKIEMRASIYGAILNITLSWILIEAYGFYGAPLGTMLSMSFAAIFVIINVVKKFNISYIETIKKSLAGPFIAALISSILIFFILQNISFIMEYPNSRWPAFILIILSGLLYCIIYVVCLFALKQINDDDKKIFGRMLSISFSKFKKNPKKETP